MKTFKSSLYTGLDPHRARIHTRTYTHTPSPTTHPHRAARLIRAIFSFCLPRNRLNKIYIFIIIVKRIFYLKNKPGTNNRRAEASGHLAQVLFCLSDVAGCSILDGYSDSILGFWHRCGVAGLRPGDKFGTKKCGILSPLLCRRLNLPSKISWKKLRPDIL